MGLEVSLEVPLLLLQLVYSFAVLPELAGGGGALTGTVLVVLSRVLLSLRLVVAPVMVGFSIRVSFCLFCSWLWPCCSCCCC